VLLGAAAVSLRIDDGARRVRWGLTDMGASTAPKPLARRRRGEAAPPLDVRLPLVRRRGPTDAAAWSQSIGPPSGCSAVRGRR
jgi:hypothetical protein